MNTKFDLTSRLGKLFVYGIYTMGIGFLGFFFYSLFIQETSAILVTLFMNLFLYFGLISKTLRLKKVTFDQDSIYLENEKIPFSEVKSIKEGEIIIFKDKNEEKIKYNYFFGENFKTLKYFYNAKNV